MDDGVNKKPPRKKPQKKQIVDSVIELDDGPGLRPGRNGTMESQPKRDLSDILTEQRFLPQSRTVMRLMEIRDDPLGHFFPTKNTPNGTFLYAGPAWLNPKLAELYLQPIANLHAKRPRAGEDQGANKKARLENGDEGMVDGVEFPRGASVAPSMHGGSDHGRMSMGPDMGMDFNDMGGMGMDFGDQVGLGDFSTGPLIEEDERDRLSTPGIGLDAEPIESYSDASCKIAIFDNNHSQAPEQDASGPDQSSLGFSKNTKKAIAFLRKDLDVANTLPGDEKVHFNDVAQKVCIIVPPTSPSILISFALSGNSSSSFIILFRATCLGDQGSCTPQTV